MKRSFFRLASASVKPLRGRRLAQKQVFEITETAAKRLQFLLSQKPDKPLGIRVGVTKRGCNGMSYTMNYEYPPTDGQAGKPCATVTDKGVTVFLDPDAEFYITGTVMDFISTDTEEKFEFLNPNADSVCGCSESFNVSADKKPPPPKA